MRTLELGGRVIGSGAPCFVIAEAGVNHNGDVALARKLIIAAAAAGADAVKFQTFITDRVMTRSAPLAEYQRENAGDVGTQHDLVRGLELPFDAHQELMRVADDHGILFLSSPFDEESADLLDRLDIAAYKVGSGELTNFAFLGHLASKRRPIILSTGMSTLAEVEAGVVAVEEAGCDDIAILHCVSCYPAAASDVNLRAMHTLSAAFGRPVGYSDHTLGLDISLAAVALGATIIEKHVTLSKGMAGPDHTASLEPAELTELVSSIRRVESALGDGRKRPAAAELDTARVARRSLATAIAVYNGEVLEERHITALRPGTGIPPGMLPQVLGRRATRDIQKGVLLTPDMFA